MKIAGPSAGSFISDGTVNIASGGIMAMTAPVVYIQTGGITIVNGMLTSGSGENVGGGTVVGTGIINGNLIFTGGTMQPGGMATPGKLTINGNYIDSNTSFNELISGTGNGLLSINGTSTIGADSQLNIDLLGGFTPISGEMFTLMDFTSGSGAFTNAPSTGFEMDGYNWTIAYNTTDIVLDAGSPIASPTPEPDSLILMGTGLAALATFLWKKRVPQRVN